MEVTLLELTPDKWSTFEERYRETIFQLPDWNQIPLIHATAARKYPDGTLVRFKGMVQDMYSPEFFFRRMQMIDVTTGTITTKLGLYKDATPMAENDRIHNADINQATQRYPLVVISIPGLNEWAKNEEDAISNKALEAYDRVSKNYKPGSGKVLNVAKRSYDDESNQQSCKKIATEVKDTSQCMKDSSMEIQIFTEPVEKPTTSINETSRVMDNTKVDAPMLTDDPMANNESTNDALNLEFSVEHYLNHPMPDVANHTCILKLYREANYIKLNDMVEAIGFLSVDPSLAGKNQFGDIMQLETPEEVLTHNPPPELIPRLHVIAIKRLEHCNPLMGYRIDQEILLPQAPSVRAYLMNVFTSMFLGDTLAAQYMICFLISHVYVRRETRSIGPLNLNITNLPMDKIPNHVKCIYDVFRNLVTKSFYMPLTVETLNSMNFLPRKDLICDRLESGILQLTTDTNLFLDETVMQPGKLTEVGFHNIAALVKLINAQRVEYNYKFFDMEMDADVPVVVFSEGKSLLPSECILPLQPEQSAIDIFEASYAAVKQFLKNDEINKVRSFLTCVKLFRFVMPHDIQYVEEDFVAMRAEAKANNPVTEDDLHRLLVLARLVALSRGLHTLDRDSWEMAKRMEAERLARVASVNIKQSTA